MKYAFVLGRVYTLSVSELIAILEKPDPTLIASGQKPSAQSPLGDEAVKILEASEEVLVVETPGALNVPNLQKKLGGVIKILEVVDVIKKRQQDSINFVLKHYFRPSVLKKQFFKEYKGKMQFGVSIYLLDMSLLKRPELPPPPPSGKGGFDKRPMLFSSNIFSEPKRLGMMIKNGLTESGLSVRLVLPEFNSLSLASVVVTKNLLLSKGAEICVLAGQENIFTAKTLSVQDFEDYGRRDYQRPVRDEKQGMIPPKVAQVMLNLSNCSAGNTILDPFCGIGTIVQEGLLLGFKMFGSDINKTAIKGSEQNLEWFRNRYKVAPGKYGLETCDATKVSDIISKSKQNISAIVTESTLGPIYSQYPKAEEMAKNFKDLEKLYKASFKEFAKFLPKKGRVVMCIPAYRRGRGEYDMMQNLDFIKELGYNQLDIISPAIAKKLKFLKLTARNTAIYDRKDQIVAREIVIFEKA